MAENSAEKSPAGAPSPAASSAAIRRAGAPREPVLLANLDLRIAGDGTWYYRGSPIQRKELVRLFASMLTRDHFGDFWLVTPHEKGRVVVDDAPFVAVEVEVRNAGRARELTFRTNIDEKVAAGEAHPIRIEVAPATGEPRPYVVVRDGLEARIERSVYYDLVDLGDEEVVDGEKKFGIWSKGVFFSLGRLDGTG
ncbi:MAG: DUF1285 domain-containing protein [Proteobacteria bacterium]|nr:DUF1285 domain-containing protein [Pseudomonadota bacterium]